MNTPLRKYSWTIEIDQEVDGRFIAEVMEVSGALAYGKTEGEAIINAARIAVSGTKFESSKNQEFNDTPDFWAKLYFWAKLSDPRTGNGPPK